MQPDGTFHLHNTNQTSVDAVKVFVLSNKNGIVAAAEARSAEVD